MEKRFQFLLAIGISSLIMFASIFAINPKILGIGLLQWIVVLGVCISLQQKELQTENMAEALEEKSENSFKEKKYAKGWFYASIVPIMVSGFGFAIAMILALFF